MNSKDIVAQRLANQQLLDTKFTTPQEVVSWLGAVQAQEYAMSKWAIGLRLNGWNDKTVEEAFNKGEILRTHAMRPTWHFVAPADIRWLQQLTAPRVHAVNGFMYRQEELDNKVLAKCANIITKALEGNKYLIREELQAVLEKKKIIASSHRLAYMIMYAELESLICSGPRKGKQFTYALLDERAKPVKSITNKEALAELSKRYFTSHGPATLKDFVWWSGLTVKEAKEGIASLRKYFAKETVDGQEYIFKPVEVKIKALPTFLMPDYDEYGIAYKDRSAIFNPDKYQLAKANGNPIFNRMIIIDGIIYGTWQRTIKGKDIIVETYPFEKLSKTKEQELNKAVKAYKDFFA